MFVSTLITGCLILCHDIKSICFITMSDYDSLDSSANQVLLMHFDCLRTLNSSLRGNTGGKTKTSVPVSEKHEEGC